MDHRITLRISDEFYHELKKEAAQSKITVSNILRNKLTDAERLHHIRKHKDELVTESIRNQEKIQSETHSLSRENNLLLRKIARHLNSRIVRQVDEKLSLNKENYNGDH